MRKFGRKPINLKVIKFQNVRKKYLQLDYNQPLQDPLAY